MRQGRRALAPRFTTDSCCRSGSVPEVFITDEMHRDWANNRTDLIAFWRSGKYTTPDTFENELPYLFVRSRPGTLPSAH